MTSASSQGLHSRRQGPGMLRDQPHPADAAVLLLLAAKDPALAHYAGSVFKGRPPAARPPLVTGSTRPVMAST